MTGVPSYEIMLRGLDPNRAPPNVLYWMDSCDGALAVGQIIGVVDGKPAQTHTIWSLCRGGDEVARVTVEGVPQLRSLPRWWPLPPEARGWIAARQAREERRRALVRKAVIWTGCTLAGMGWIIASFLLGYLTGQ